MFVTIDSIYHHHHHSFFHLIQPLFLSPISCFLFTSLPPNPQFFHPHPHQLPPPHTHASLLLRHDVEPMRKKHTHRHGGVDAYWKKMGTLVSNADAYVVTAGERYPTSWVTIPHVDKCQVYLGGEQDVAVRCMETLCKSIQSEQPEKEREYSETRTHFV